MQFFLYFSLLGFCPHEPHRFLLDQDRLVSHHRLADQISALVHEKDGRGIPNARQKVCKIIIHEKLRHGGNCACNRGCRSYPRRIGCILQIPNHADELKSRRSRISPIVDACQ